MNDKYCLPIIKKSSEEVVKAIELNIEKYGAFEVWLDYLEDFDFSLLQKLAAIKNKKIILLFRRKNLDPIKMYLSKRIETINAISKTNLWIDLDITQKEEIEHAKKIKLTDRLIISFHDYSNTPEDVYLKKIVGKILEHKPEIIKISTMCNKESDVLRLLKLKKDFMKNRQKHIVLGMGEKGKITRMFGALWGNELIFIPESTEEQSAPGQITRSEFDKIMEKIESARK